MTASTETRSASFWHIVNCQCCLLYRIKGLYQCNTWFVFQVTNWRHTANVYHCFHYAESNAYSIYAAYKIVHLVLLKASLSYVSKLTLTFFAIRTLSKLPHILSHMWNSRFYVVRKLLLLTTSIHKCYCRVIVICNLRTKFVVFNASSVVASMYNTSQIARFDAWE